MQTLIRIGQLLTALWALTSHAQAARATEQAEQGQPTLVIARAGHDNASSIVARCLQPAAAKEAACLFPLDSSETTLIAFNGEVVSSAGELAKYRHEGSHITLYLESPMPQAPLASATKAVRRAYAKTVQTSLQPKLKEAVNLRNSIATALGQTLDGSGRVGGVELGLPLLHSLATAEKGAAGGSLTQRVQRLLSEANKLQKINDTRPRLSALETSFAVPAVRDALRDFLSRNHFPLDKAADIAHIRSLYKAADVAPPSEGPLTSLLFWIVAAVVAGSIAMVSAIFGARVMPGPDIATQAAVRSIPAAFGLSAGFADLNELMRRAREKVDYSQVVCYLQRAAIWLLVAGGYERALRLLREEINPAEHAVRDDAPELELLALTKMNEIRTLRASVDKLKQQSLEARSGLELQVGAVRSQAARDLEELRASLEDAARDREACLARTRQLLQLVFASYEIEAAAVQFIIGTPGTAADGLLPRAVIDKVEWGRANAKELKEVNIALELFKPAGSPPQTGMLRDFAVQKATLARTVALRLQQIAQENGLARSQDDPDAQSTAILQELRRTKQARLDCADYKGARELLHREFPAHAAHETGTVSDLVQMALDSLRAVRRDVAAQGETIAELHRQGTALEIQVTDERTAREAALAELDTADATLASVVDHWVGGGIERLQELGLLHPDIRRSRKQRFDYARVLPFAAELDPWLLACRFAVRALAAEIARLGAMSRHDLVATLYLERITKGLGQLSDRRLGLRAGGAPADASKEAHFMRFYLPCLQDGWLHLLLRADGLSAVYWGSASQLRPLLRSIALAASVAEGLLAQVDAAVLRPGLLSVPGSGVKTRYAAELGFRALPEVRSALASYVDRGEGVTVDIFEIGIASPYFNLEPCVILLNPSEWRQ